MNALYVLQLPYERNYSQMYDEIRSERWPLVALGSELFSDQAFEFLNSFILEWHYIRSQVQFWTCQQWNLVGWEVSF